MADIKVTKLFDEGEIAARVEALAEAAAARLPADFVIVALLVGSFVFVADLIRALHRRGSKPVVEFLRLSSYGLAQQTSGEIRMIGGLEFDVAGRVVLLVDDIVDTGRTLAYARDLLRDRKAARVLTCALVDKPSRREVEIDVDFVGFTVPNIFIVGYGIDYAHAYRYLPYIGRVD